MAILSFDIKKIFIQHVAWIAQMNWFNKPTLEYLALIFSELGEAANECRQVAPTANFGVELGDIVLRIIALSHADNFDIGKELEANPPTSVLAQYDDLSPLASLAILGTFVSKAVEASLKPNHDEYARALSTLVYEVDQLALREGINFAQVLDEKIALNRERGSRGRLI